MVDRDTLRHPPEPYLGWYFEGEPGSPGTGTYRWYANEDAGTGAFRAVIDTSAITGDLRQQYEEGMTRGLALCKGKVFLGTWIDGSEESVHLPKQTDTPSQQALREAVLKGLYRLYEQGFSNGDFKVDLDGVALELGVDRVLLDRAVEFLQEEGHIRDFGAADRNASTGDFWISVAGVKQVEEWIAERTSRSRATKTFLFTDVENSTALTEALGDDAARRVLRANENVVREAIRAHDGQEIKRMGDGTMAAFGSATSAITCSIAIQEALDARARVSEVPVLVKIGVNSGEPVFEDKDYYGRAVNIAARLCAEARGGEILVSAVVRELVRGQRFAIAAAGTRQLKGLDQPFEVLTVGWRGGSKDQAVFSPGDSVTHPKFGIGIVISSAPAENDQIVVVAFQGEAGIKKLLLSFAPLERIQV